MGANPIRSIYKFPCLWKLVALRVLREVDEDESGPELVLLDEPHALDLELPLGAHPDELVKVEAAEVERDVVEGVVHRVEGLLPTLGEVAGKILLREIISKKLHSVFVDEFRRWVQSTCAAI